MSDTATVPSAAVIEPDPNRAVPARLDFARVGRILRLLHTLVAYGKNLVETLRRERYPDDIPSYPFLTSIFGTSNPALITVTIIRGLLRAAALQARLSSSVARPRYSLLSLRVRAWAAEQTKPGGRGPSRGRPRAAASSIPPGWPAGDHSFDRQPTPEEEMFAEIVAEDHDRPIGPILIDICLDLGIVPGQMDPATWDELRLAIALNGGDPAGLAGAGRKTPDLFRGHSAEGIGDPSGSPPYPPWPAPSPALACTGPP